MHVPRTLTFCALTGFAVSLAEECVFTGPVKDAYIAGCSQDCQSHGTLEEAQTACKAALDCNGVTLSNNKYELRAARVTASSTKGEVSWLLSNGDICRQHPALPLYDDFHYPAEEEAELAKAAVPTVLSVTAGGCKLHCEGADQSVAVGESACGWQVMGTTSDALVALERRFERWGLLVLASQKSTRLLRKSVGQLSGIHQPYFNFSGSLPGYFSTARASKLDYPSAIAANLTDDGEFDYPSLASVLAPQRDIAEISNAADAAKFVVTHNGRIKCASYHGKAHNGQGDMNGIAEFDDLHAAPPNNQTVIFDPSDHVQYWPNRFENTKTGLVGGHLRVANVGSYSPSVKNGFELIAFSPTNNSRNHPRVAGDDECIFTGPFNNTYVAGCSQGCQKHSSLEEAKSACASVVDCNGVTFHQSHWELRASKVTNATSTSEVSWLLANGDTCRHTPRRPGIEYNPGVYVRLHEETEGKAQALRHFYVTNFTKQEVDPSEFYSKLAEYVQFYDVVLQEGMQVNLPASDRRQEDMANSALLSAWGNYLGDQSNYGNGATYWSIGREDNGSLPLNILSVEEANLEWGLCHLALPHIGYYFDNNVRSDGTVNYWTWGGLGDSVGDTGRLVSLYIKARQLCGDDAWARQYMPTAEAFGRLMLDLRAVATSQSSNRSKETRGLIVGQPEHDWHNTRDKFFYNNNVWILRGMEELGSLLSTEQGLNATLGKMLMDDAAQYRIDLENSVDLCTVAAADGSPDFLPPWAEVGKTPYDHMTDGRESEYSNFRFFSETVLADVLSRDLEDMLLTWHNSRGGRLGGASRFSNWLDDMPTAGWGYGALTNNRTDDFLALLYGHMATYQSRGTFHSTEQLSFTGEGWYRDFLHLPNHKPNETGVQISEQNHPLEAQVGYYGTENDVSFCIVSQIIVTRMTRWQLVFEDFYRPGANAKGSIWLARGAPKRWFSKGSTGFSVANAPTRVGKVSYKVTVDEDGSATFSVTPPTGVASKVQWKLRWPYAFDHVDCVGCAVQEIADNGVVTVSPNSDAGFQATARLTAEMWV